MSAGAWLSGEPTGFEVKWGNTEDPAKVFVIEVQGSAFNRMGLWTTTAMDPDDAVRKFRRVNTTDAINRVLFDTGWHREHEQVEQVDPEPTSATADAALDRDPLPELPYQTPRDC